MARRSFAAVAFNVTGECVLYSIGSRDLRLKLRLLNPASWTSLLDCKSSTHDINQRENLLARDNRSAR